MVMLNIAKCIHWSRAITAAPTNQATLGFSRKRTNYM